MERGNTPTPPLANISTSSSPPPNCAICLGRFKNKSYTETCLHEFCFNCLLKWSKIRALCPLCKQPFKSIIHNVRSNDSYDKYIVEQQQEPPFDFPAEFDEFRRFRYRTTLTLRPGQDLAIQRLLVGYVPETPPYAHLPRERRRRPHPQLYVQSPRYHCTRRSYTSFRKMIYRRNLWVNPRHITGRYRDTSPTFYRNGLTQISRLVPWLKRELSALISNTSDIIFCHISRITDAIQMVHIKSRQFRELIASLLPNEYVDHFIHEFFNFASSPYDLIGYDRVTMETYLNRSPTPAATGADNYVSEIQPISSSEREDSSDSDVFLVPSVPGTSNGALQAPLANDFTTSLADPERNLSDPLIIETISHSETEDSLDEVIMVGYIKPPEQRTPEVVDLLASDSDVIIEDQQTTASMSPNLSSVKPPSPQTPPLNLPSTSGLVKLSVKRNLSPTISLSDSDSDFANCSSRYKKSKSDKRTRKHTDTSDDKNFDTDSSSSSYLTPRCYSSTSSTSEWSNISSKLDDSDESAQKKKRSKKSKHKKYSKKSSSSKKKHKHKSSKPKKRHKNKDKYSSSQSEKNLIKGKYCKYSKSKIRQQKE